jgi:iron complex transport system ATP-binding protein
VTGTSGFEERALWTLSGGERQKVFIAAAFAQGAKVLLLDEPTTFLDPKHQTDVYRLLARLNGEQGVTIVSVTHDINSAALTSSRVLALKRGTVAFYGNTDEFMDKEILYNIYEKEFLFMRHPQTGKTIVAPEIP